MACRNNYLVGVITVVLLCFLFMKPLTPEHTSCMTDGGGESRRNAILANASEIKIPSMEGVVAIPDSTYTYGNVELSYNSDPTSMDYYRIDIINGKLNIPDSQVLTNKKLYEYSTTVVPQEKNIMYKARDDEIFDKLVNDTYCCDDIANREIVYSFLYDNAQNRYGSVRESYFD